MQSLNPNGIRGVTAPIALKEGKSIEKSPCPMLHSYRIDKGGFQPSEQQIITVRGIYAGILFFSSDALSIFEDSFLNTTAMISFEAIINSLEEAIILFDKATTILYVNKTAEEFLRKNAKDAVGKKFSQIINGEKAISPLIKKTIGEGRSFRGKSVHMNAGQAGNMDFTLSPFFINGRIEGAVLSLYENINIAEKEDLDFDSIVYMLGSIAHEIKNPLGGIKGAAQLLLERELDAPPEEHVHLIIRETDRLNSILHDYLTICRKPSFSAVNIHEVMEKALHIMDVPIRKAGVVLKRFYDPSLPQVRGDEAKLLQVFLNIVKNAIESMKKGGRMEISTYPSTESVRERGRTKRWALISITDTGKGIAEGDLRKIFIPFYTRKKNGTGIGLALSKKIVKDHGGLIKVKSQEGKGTSFFIYIPFESNG
jgi:two-component system, NtrC family, nitrogen regulation sensor histidine kinase GlnL